MRGGRTTRTHERTHIHTPLARAWLNSPVIWLFYKLSLGGAVRICIEGRREGEQEREEDRRDRKRHTEREGEKSRFIDT